MKTASDLAVSHRKPTAAFAIALFAALCAFAPSAWAADWAPVEADLASENIVVTLSDTSFVYDGTAHIPTVEVADYTGYGEGTDTYGILREGVDYTMALSRDGAAVTSPVKAGEVLITLTGQGAYCGTTTCTYTITPRQIAKTDIKLSKTSYLYNGKVHIPTVTVTVDGKTLKKGTSYKVTMTRADTGAVVTKPVKAGTIRVKVTGIGNYKGTWIKTYTIKKSCKIVYKGNGATKGSMAAQRVAYADWTGLKKVAYKKSGYYFAGWSKTKSGTGSWYADTEPVSKICKSGGTVTLYAQWVNDKSSSSKQTKAAKTVAKCIAKVAKRYWTQDGCTTQLELVQYAAAITGNYYNMLCTYSMEAPDYWNAYGFFVKKKTSCAGTTAGMGMVLDQLGFKWKHAHKGEYTHQWCTLTCDGKKAYADGQVGMANYGKHPVA